MKRVTRESLMPRICKFCGKQRIILKFEHIPNRFGSTSHKYVARNAEPPHEIHNCIRKFNETNIESEIN